MLDKKRQNIGKNKLILCAKFSQVLITSVSFMSHTFLREQKRQCSETTTAGARYLIHNDMVH